MLLRRLLKWLAIALGVLAVALLAFVWVVLDVNPFEGAIEAPWTLVSTGVGFYVQFPGTRLADGPLAADLAGKPGFERLAAFREELARAARQVAEQANPRIPLGLFEIDLQKDFLHRQMAIAGDIADPRTMRLVYFVAVARVPFYARFVSALRREFVRKALPGVGDRVELRNKYFRVQLPPDVVARLAPYRATMAREDGDDALFFARIGDAIVMSDRAQFVADAFQSANTLRADPLFEQDFIRRMEGGQRVEGFFRDRVLQGVTGGARGGGGGRLAALNAILPPELIGQVTAFADVGEDGVIEAAAVDRPPSERLRRAPRAVAELLDAEKGDARHLLGPEGLGRFIPRERTVAAFAFHASGDTLRTLLVENMPAEDRLNIDDLVREKSKHAYTGLDRLLEEIAKSLGTDHLLILHRPSEFDLADTRTFTPESKPYVLNGELTATLVLQVSANVPPDNVREMIRQRLPYLNFDVSNGLHPGGKFYCAEMKTKAPELAYVEPAYGVMPGGLNYVFISSYIEGAEALVRTVEKSAEPLVADPAIAALVSRLPREASIAGIVVPSSLKQHLADRVRQYVRDNHLDFINWSTEYRQGLQRQGRQMTDDQMDQEVQDAWKAYTEDQYPRLREEYLRSLGALDAFTGLAFSCALGEGPDKIVRVRAALGVDRGGGQP